MRKVLGIINGAVLYLATAAPAFAQTPIPLAPPTGSVGTVDVAKIPQFILTVLFVLGVIIAIAYLIYGGIRWILSGGDKTAVDAARQHIVAAIIGLAIILAAFLIINAVFFILTGKPFDPNNICIPTLENPTCKK